MGCLPHSFHACGALAGHSYRMSQLGLPTGSVTLLEREAELERLEAAVVAACAGTPGVVLVEGPAGIGKTELLRAARGRAEREGMEVRFAGGAELERELGLGVARQLFEPPVLEAGIDEQADLHALYWHSVRLAERAPLLILVDDLHWCDIGSLRWLAYLARRLEDLPILLLLARRTDEAATDENLLAALAGEPSVEAIRPAPLSADAVRELISGRFDDRPEEGFVKACHGAAGGNPLFTVQLLEVARADGLRPLDVEAEATLRLAPEGASRLVLDRLRRLSPAAITVGEHIALFGTRAEARQVALLSGLTVPQVLEVADELTAAGLLRSTQPLAFTHPIVRSAIHESIPTGRRAAGHDRVARVLDDEGESPARVALHLLESPPAADPWAVGVLSAAAARAAAPEAAAAYLRRAAAEPPTRPLRPGILLALGEAEARTYHPGAVGHLEEALRLGEAPAARAAAAIALADSLVQHDRAGEAEPILRAAIAELGEPPPGSGAPDRDLLLRLEAELLHAELTAGRLSRQRLDEAIAVAGPGNSAAELELLATAAYVGAAAGATADEVAALAHRALRDDRLLELESLLPAHAAVWALEFAGAYDDADHRLLAIMAEAQRRGSPSQLMLAASARAAVAYRRGALADAEQEARTALELAEAHGRSYGSSISVATLVAALAGQGRLAEAEAALADGEGGGAKCDVAVYVERRGWLRAAQGRTTAAVAEFREAGRLLQEAGHDFPGFSDWRVGLAGAELARGRSEEAAALARGQLGLVRHFGGRGATGPALRTLGLATGGADGLDLLAEAAAELERSPALLERAKTELELGAALRRAGKRAAAQEPLRSALDLADRCGAAHLAERAREELVAAGARPRRTRVSGVEALTASELRVARRAADGQTNREIAADLFVTKKAVEKHLASTYRKLDIGGRGELAAALSGLAA